MAALSRATGLTSAFSRSSALALAIHTGAGAQVGQNINVITGSDVSSPATCFASGRTNRSAGISSINTSHMMVAYNDYRTVDYLEDPGAVVPPSLLNATFQKLLRFLTLAAGACARPPMG